MTVYRYIVQTYTVHLMRSSHAFEYGYFSCIFSLSTACIACIVVSFTFVNIARSTKVLPTIIITFEQCSCNIFDYSCLPFIYLQNIDNVDFLVFQIDRNIKVRKSQCHDKSSMDDNPKQTEVIQSIIEIMQY